MEDDRKTPTVMIDLIDEVPASTKRSPSFREGAPFEFETEMNHFLMRFRDAMDQGVFGSQTDSLKQSFNERGPSLIEAGKCFDNLTVNGIGNDQLVLGSEMDPVIEALNKNTKVVPWGRNFSDVVVGYYAELEMDVDRLVARMRTQGMDYMMKGVYGPNEEASEDIEAVLRKLQEAKTRISDEELVPRSNSYADIEEMSLERMKRISQSSTMPEEMELARVDRHLIAQRLEQVVSMIQEGLPAEQTADRLMRVTHDITNYLGTDLGGRGLKLMGSKGKRPLRHLDEGPLYQLEAMMSLVNVVIRDHEGCVTLHRDLIRGNTIAPAVSSTPIGRIG